MYNFQVNYDKNLDISKASVHNIQYLNDVKMQLPDCILIADRGYIDQKKLC